jgi:hypothetical protein
MNECEMIPLEANCFNYNVSNRILFLTYVTICFLIIVPTCPITDKNQNDILTNKKFYMYFS